MIYLGNNEIKSIYLGNTNIVSGFIGTTPFWGSEEPVVTMTPDFVVHYYVKPEGETLNVARGGCTDIIDKVGRYNLETGQYEVIEYGLDDLEITVEENEPFQYGFTLKDKTVMDMMPFSDYVDVREIDLHTLTTLRKLTGSIASPYSRDPNDFVIDLPNTVQRFEHTPCVCATVRIWDNGAYRYGLPSGVTYIGMPEGHEEDEGLGGGAFDGAKLWSGDYTDIYEFIIPASVTHLEKGAFANAQLPPLVTVNSTVGVPDYLFDSASFGNEGTANLIDIKIAEGNTSVGANAFMVYGGTSQSIPWVYSLSLPSTLRTIGDGAFAGMMFSVGLDLPSGLTTIGEAAFTRIYMEKEFGDLEITIPASVTTIGAGAFNGAEIKALHFNSTTPATLGHTEDEGSYPFDDCQTREDEETHERKPTPLYVPCEAVTAYKTAWSMYEDRISCQRSIINPNFDVYYQKQEGDETDWQIFNPALINLIDKIGVYNANGECEEYDIPSDGKLPYATLTGDSRMGFILKTPTALDTGLFENTEFHEIDGIITTAPWTRVYNSVGGTPLAMGEEKLIDLPDTVQRIEDWACAGLIVSLPDGHGGFEMSRLPSACTYIGDYAFEFARLMNDDSIPFEIPARITHIGEFAFEGAALPKTINFNATIGVPDEFMFQMPFYVSSVNIAEGNTSIGAGAFHSGAIKNFSLPSTLRTIGEDAFYGVGMNDGESEGSGITIPASVTSIGSSAFQSTSIPAIYFNSTTPATIGDDVFTDCKTADNTPTPIYVPCEAIDTYKAAWTAWADRITCDSPAPYGYKAKLTLTNGEEVEIPKTATTDVTITNADFGYDNIASAVIYSGVTTIGNDAFGGSSISAITLPNTLTTITDGAFLQCRRLSSITLPDSVTTIGNNAFDSCTSLTSVTIPNSVTTIGESAFEYCALTSATLPNGVTSIGKKAFRGCPLTSVTLPTGLTEIGERAFDLCNSLTSAIVIPSGVTSIGENAFWQCPLASVTVESTTPATLGHMAFGDPSYTGCPIYVPCEAVDTYKAAAGWSDYANKIKCLDPSEEYFHFISLANGSQVKANSKFQYSLDGGTTWTAGDNAMKTLNNGEKIYFKGTNSSALGANVFNTRGSRDKTSKFELRGNIMSLLYGDNFIGQTTIPCESCFAEVFRARTGNTFDSDYSIVKADKLVLPAVVATKGCYATMFDRCRSLTAAPSISSLKTLSDGCCGGMFSDCSSLTKAPDIPNVSFGNLNEPLASMFKNCTNLTYIKAMFTTLPSKGGIYPTRNWLDGVASSGTFVKNANATWDVRGEGGIPNGWTVITVNP